MQSLGRQVALANARIGPHPGECRDGECDGRDRDAEHRVPAEELHHDSSAQGGGGGDSEHGGIVDRLRAEPLIMPVGAAEQRGAADVEEVPAHAEGNHRRAVVQDFAAREADDDRDAKR